MRGAEVDGHEAFAAIRPRRNANAVHDIDVVVGFLERRHDGVRDACNGIEGRGLFKRAGHGVILERF